ncbi:MAG: hypothetical protein M3Z27_06705 [Actinomycetota bacterium]|nr:hypothetical protein [Actinomycetota bacterium]
MIGSEPAAAPPAVEPVAPTRRPRALAGLPGLPLAAVLAGCLVLGILSVVALSWPPGSDPWAWIDWGQEIASSKIALSLAGGPSWKPFPVVFTTIFGFFSHTGPDLWLVVSRTAGLLALVGAFRVARRFGGLVAGVLAVVALCLAQDSLFYFARGASEPIVAALTLWAIDRHLSAQPRTAYVLVFLATMNRPEFTAFLALYGLYLWLRVPGSRPLAVGLLVLVPVAWLGGPAVISGNPFQAGNAALGGKGSPGNAPAELASSVKLMGVPTLVLGAVGLALAYVRREMTLVWLGAGAIAWALMVAIITQVAYGLPRYLLPAGTIACVLVGVAVVWTAQEAGRRRGTGAALTVGVVLVAATLPWSIPRGHSLVSQARDAGQAALYIRQMFTAADRVGGRARVLPCRSSVVAVNHTLASALAWKLQVPERRVRPLLRGTGFVFSAPHVHAAGAPPPIVHASEKTVRTLARVRPWRVLEVTGLGASATPSCALHHRGPRGLRASAADSGSGSPAP